MPKGTLQSRFFAVNCMYQKDGAPLRGGVPWEKNRILRESSEEYRMLNRLLVAMHGQCKENGQGHRVASGKTGLRIQWAQKAVVQGYHSLFCFLRLLQLRKRGSENDS